MTVTCESRILMALFAALVTENKGGKCALSYKWVFFVGLYFACLFVAQCALAAHSRTSEYLCFFALLVGLYFACWFVAHIYCLLHTFSGYLVYISVSVYISKSLDLSFIDGSNCFLSLSGWLPRKRDSSDPGDLYDKMSNWCDPLSIWSTGNQNSFPGNF